MFGAIQWRTADQNSVNHNIKTSTSVFDGSGYQLQFPFSLTADEYKQQISSLFDEGHLFNLTTLELAVLNFDFYEPSLDIFYAVELAFHFSAVSSILEPIPLKTGFYRSMAGEDAATKFLVFCQVAKLVLSLYTVWLIALKVHYRELLGDLGASLARDVV